MPLFGRKDNSNSRDLDHEATCPGCHTPLYRPAAGTFGANTCSCGRMVLSTEAGTRGNAVELILRVDGREVMRIPDHRIEDGRRRASEADQKRDAFDRQARDYYGWRATQEYINKKNPGRD